MVFDEWYSINGIWWMVFDKWYLIKSISAVTNYNSSSCLVCCCFRWFILKSPTIAIVCISWKQYFFQINFKPFHLKAKMAKIYQGGKNLWFMLDWEDVKHVSQ